MPPTKEHLPQAACRLDDVVLLEAPLPFRRDLPAFLLTGDGREPARVDLLSWPEEAELDVELGVAAVMPPDALTAATAGTFPLGAAKHTFVARRWLPGVDAGALLDRLATLTGDLDVRIAAALGAAMTRGLARVPPQLFATPADLRIGWDGRVGCRTPLIAPEFQTNITRARWMAPELIRNAPPTTAALVHQAAAMVFALLARQHFVALSGGPPLEDLLPVIRGRRTPILERRPDVDRDLARTLDASLSIEPDARPSLDELHATLARRADGGSSAALAHLLAGLFPAERDASLLWWSDARCLDLESAPTVPVTRPAPPTDLTAAVQRVIDERSTRT